MSDFETVIGDLIEERKLDEVKDLILKELEKDANNIKALEQYCIYLNEVRYPVDCEQNCEKLLKIEPTNKIGLSELALVYRVTRRFEEGIKLIDKAITLDKENEKFYYYKAFIYNSWGKHKNSLALKEIEKCLDINPSYALGLALKGLIYSEEKQHIKAISTLDKAISLSHKDPRIHNFCGLNYRDMDKDDLAMKAFAQAFEIDPKFSVAIDNYGDIITRKNGIKEGIEWYRKALEANPKNSHARVSLADCLKKMSQYEEALKELEIGIKYEENYSWLHNKKGEVYLETKDYYDARNSFKTAISLYQDNCNFLSNLGWALLYLKKYEDAMDYFNEALDLNSYHEGAQKGSDICIEYL